MCRFHFALLALLLSLAAQPLVAATYYAGNCRAGAFGTINAAVAAVPAGSTIDICSGIYPEQLVISKALTLQGAYSNNSSQAVITVPSGGLATTPSVSFGTTVAAQVEITAGPVNLTNLTVDGTAGTNCPGSYYIGIDYSSGSSGTVNNVGTRNQNCNSAGIGMMAENGAGALQSVKIENSNIRGNTYYGILTCNAASTPSLTSTISGNYVAGANYGIAASCNAHGIISGNTVVANIGIMAGTPNVTISGNTVIGGMRGIDAEANPSITSNRIFNTTDAAIWLNYDGASIKSNTITNATIGVQFHCHTGTVTGNTINGAATALDFVPSAFIGVNKYNDVTTVRNQETCP
jgi:hypothetical protein